jgi:hypothetical protein
MPAGDTLQSTASAGGIYLVTEPEPAFPAKGSEVRIVRCVLHGIAYDSEREVCPECAK